MAKKRRHAATQRASAETSREPPVDPEAMEKSLETSEAFFDQLNTDVVGIPATLERTLLLHNLVALVVQNALLVTQSVSRAEIAMVVGTAVWMTRTRFVGMFLPHVALRSSINREVSYRSTILVLAVGGLGAAIYKTGILLEKPQLVLFALVLLLDVVSIHLVRVSDGRLTPGQIALSTIETTFLVAGFSTCLHYKRGLIFDEMAYGLTAATAFVHVLVLLTTEYAVGHCFDSDANGTFAAAQQRGAALMERIWQDIDQFEPEQLLLGVGASKKKKTKNKRPSKAVGGENGNSVEKVLQTKRSVFLEPRVRLAVLTLIQMLLLTAQVFLSAFVLYSWEIMSVLLFSSSHVLWTLGQVRRKVLSSTVRSAGFEIAKHKSE